MVLYLALLAALYVRAIVVLRRRGWEVPRSQQAFWWVGMALSTAGLLGPDAHGTLLGHMTEHLLIADLAVPFLLAGMRTPVLQHLIPPVALRPLARQTRLRSAFRFLRRPLTGIVVWIFVLYGWHFAFAFEGALRSPWIHALQHLSFVGGSILVWWSVIEPQKGRLHGELWKIGQLMGARLSGMFLGMAFILAGSPAYASFYGEESLRNQQYAGGLMLGVDLLIMLFALGFFFWRSAVDHDRKHAAGLVTLMALVVAFAGCGGSDEQPKPKVNADEKVIRDWITKLNEGDVEGAADLFADDAIVEQAEEVRLKGHKDAVEFNRSLPCKAKLTDVDPEGTTSLASFALDGGSPGCDSGVQVRFLILDGKIEQWRQLPTPQGEVARLLSVPNS
ncbi:MAG: cytochrome c oxidase assembly protein [Thermoleophilaceae bacterium]|nr:cytochrome c oxidase assembly protein [Thermoleophilaceae bacterium]